MGAGRIEVDIEPGPGSAYLQGRTLYFDYQDVDLSDVGPETLIIPALGAVLPIAYAAGLAVEVPVVDAGYAAAADHLAVVWQQLHPSFRGEVFSLDGSRIEAPPTATEGALLLYSGGLDSVASLIAHRGDVRTLLSVWGADTSPDDTELWDALSDVVDRSELVRGLPRVVLRTNVRQVVHERRLTREFLLRSGKDWWGAVHHGTALLSMAAPVTSAHGLARVLIASTHSVEWTPPWGSSPRTDPLLRWGEVTVQHDLFHLSRQRKIADQLVPYLREGGSVTLNVCHQQGRGGRTNCGRCEKCLRTASGLLAGGVEPSTVGVDVARADLDDWRRRISRADRRLSTNEMFMWRDVQRGVSRFDHPGAPPGYLEWLAHADLSAVIEPPPNRRARSYAVVRFWAGEVGRSLPASVQDVLRRRPAPPARRGPRPVAAASPADRRAN